jgi:hypothetical protein
MPSCHSRGSTAAKLAAERLRLRACTSDKAEAPVHQNLTAELLVEVAQLWLATGWIVVVAVAAPVAAVAWVFGWFGNGFRKVTDALRCRHPSARTPVAHHDLTGRTDLARSFDMRVPTSARYEPAPSLLTHSRLKQLSDIHSPALSDVDTWLSRECRRAQRTMEKTGKRELHIRSEVQIIRDSLDRITAGLAGFRDARR